MRKFTIADLPEVNSWYRARNLPEVPAEALSLTGFIEPGVAAGWMYSTDSAIALCESYISNPEAAPVLRHHAMDEITAAIIEEAKTHGFKWVIAYSTATDLNARGTEKHGFVVSKRATALVRSL